MTDLPIYLPGDTYLTALVIDPEFKVMSELMQRAVVLLILSNDPNMMVNGLPVITLLRQSTSAIASTLVMMLGGVADTIKSYLNEDLSADEEEVDSVTFGTELDENDESTIKVTLTLRLRNNEEETTTVYRYE